MNVLDAIIAYERGTLEEEEVLDLFQVLINSGQVWNLQGSYGRTARDLINAGLCTCPTLDPTEHYPEDDHETHS